MLRPDMTLVIDLDDRLSTQETTDEIKRCYSHIGAPVLRKHHEEAPAGGGEAPMHNSATMMVDLGTNDYLHSEEEGADELWADTVEPWIHSMVHKVGNNMKVFNDRQRKIALPQVLFERLDIELGDGEFTVGLHTDPVSFVDPDLSEQVGLARRLLNDGTIAGAVRVDAPTEEAYRKQEQAARAVWDAEHPGKPEAVEFANTEDDPEGGKQLIPDADDEEAYQEWLAADEEAKSYENTAVPPTDDEELPRPERPEEPEEPEQFDFDVDYSLWTVTYGDGTTRQFDSDKLEFVA